LFSDGSVNEYGNAAGGMSQNPQRLDPGEFLMAVTDVDSGNFLGASLEFEKSSNRALKLAGYLHKNKTRTLMALAGS